MTVSFSDGPVSRMAILHSHRPVRHNRIAPCSVFDRITTDCHRLPARTDLELPEGRNQLYRQFTAAPKAG
jgi:hypothetical protein